MNTLFSNKYIWLLLILIGLQVPLSMIESQIQDRTIQRDIAREAVRKSWTGEQSIFASILVVPYQEKLKIESKHYSKNDNGPNHEWINRRLYIIPKKLSMDSIIKNQALSKGIYQVPVYTAEIKINSYFDLQPLKQLAKSHENSESYGIRFQQPAFISVGVKDTRGIIGTPKIELLKMELEVKPGTLLDFYSSGFHGKISIVNLSQPTLELNSIFTINGMEQLSFLAIAKQNRVTSQSDWPHPVFNGAFLPITRKISNSGYSAVWQTGIFSTNILSVLEDCYQGNCNSLNESRFGVKHTQPVDIYLQSLRSIKYGMLVILVTFSIFILYEIITKDLAIHPISYVLTGMALALFFLLLIALSEHISFLIAYWISSISCSGLIAYYVAFQSNSKNQGAYIMGILNSLYLILFLIIRSEDHALLSGSLLLFFLLAAVIYITRKVDWFNILENKI